MLLVKTGWLRKQQLGHYFLFSKGHHSVRPFAVKIQIKVERWEIVILFPAKTLSLVTLVSSSFSTNCSYVSDFIDSNVCRLLGAKKMAVWACSQKLFIYSFHKSMSKGFGFLSIVLNCQQNQPRSNLWHLKMTFQQLDSQTAWGRRLLWHLRIPRAALETTMQ